MINQPRFALLLVVLAAVPLAAQSDPTAEELENRRRLEQWRKHPEQLARLRAHAQAFLALPSPRRQQLIKLDHDLHEEASSVQTRLTNVADRYAAWIGQLKRDPLRQTDYQRILDAPDKAARLIVIRELREQDWLRDQPKAVCEDMVKLKGKDRAERIKLVKEEDRLREREWLIAGRFWDQLVKEKELPCRLTDFLPEVQTYVNEYLHMFLSKKEKDRLEKAQGKWPLYPMTLVELADKHPPALLGPNGPQRFEDLPREVKKRFENKKFIKPADGKWPTFGIMISRMAGSPKNPSRIIDFPNELWPHRQQGLSKPMLEFVTETLWKVEKEDFKALAKPPTTWPQYPLLIQDLAKKYHLTPPWFTLPGPASLWEPYRLPKPLAVQGLPELPQQQLRDFLQFGLNDQDREAIKLPADDPAFWQRLHQIYFERNPQELRNLRQRDQRKHRPTPLLEVKDKLDKLD